MFEVLLTCTIEELYHNAEIKIRKKFGMKPVRID